MVLSKSFLFPVSSFAVLTAFLQLESFILNRFIAFTFMTVRRNFLPMNPKGQLYLDPKTNVWARLQINIHTVHSESLYTTTRPSR